MQRALEAPFPLAHCPRTHLPCDRGHQEPGVWCLPVHFRASWVRVYSWVRDTESPNGYPPTPDVFTNSPIKQDITTTNAIIVVCCKERTLCWESAVWVHQALLQTNWSIGSSPPGSEPHCSQLLAGSVHGHTICAVTQGTKGSERPEFGSKIQTRETSFLFCLRPCSWPCLLIRDLDEKRILGVWSWPLKSIWK